ncbi:MAG: dihydrodipicolinate synthase family protein [Acidobacteria bacterium]|nr:MAG: dihydrodipicolinate synthase family protein [Acidobacteriota bacterium]
MKFAGVMPAITTALKDDLSVDHPFIAKHVRWLVEHGSTGIVPLGSLGESSTLSFDEKCDILRTCVSELGDSAPVVPGIASLSTSEAVRLAKESEQIGCRGLMVLPPYVYQGQWHETKAHFKALLESTNLPCMLYNNPIAYGTDVTPPQIAELAEEHENLRAVKESSGNLRRITGIKALLGDRLVVFAGLDDMVVEGVAAGATGWIAGLINALPKESIALFDAAMAGDAERAFEIYRWFLPLLRLDTLPEFVQHIKLVQAQVDMGSETVRPPRLPLPPSVREATIKLTQESLANRPSLG